MIDDSKFFSELKDREKEVMNFISRRKRSEKAGFNPNQARDRSGKWTSGGAWHKIDVNKQVDAHKASWDPDENMSGSTFDPETGKNLLGAKNLYSVGLPTAVTVTDKNDVTPEILTQYLIDKKDVFSQGRRAMGTWYSPSDGGLYLDVVELVEGREAAERLAKKNNQIGIYDLENDKYIETGGSGKFKVFVMSTKGKKRSMAEFGKFMRAMHGKKPKQEKPKDGKKG